MTAVPVTFRSNKSTITKDLSGVLEASMCIGCGVCQFADPTVEVRLDPTKLIYEPSHASNEVAASVCPAVAVDFEGLQSWRFPGAEQTSFGVVHSVLLAQSTNRDRNLRASSGGLVKELLLHYLDQPDVDGVLALGHVGGIDFETRLVTEPEGVDQLPGSIYHNLAQPKALELLHELEGRYVLVAIPCQLEGIFSYIRTLAPELAEKVHTTIGLLCGWQYSHHSLRAIADFKKLDLDDVTDISYRGEGPVGRLRMWTGDEVHAVGRRGRLQLPGRLRPVVQHPALPHLRQPLELPRRHRRGRRLVALHGVVHHRRVAAGVPHGGDRRGGAGDRGQGAGEGGRGLHRRGDGEPEASGRLR